MSILSCFGFGEKRILNDGYTAVGVITSVKKCWWLKVNQKAIRLYALDGAVFPHIIRFTYQVDGKEYSGSRYISWTADCPLIQEEITVYYSKENPSKYALRL